MPKFLSKCILELADNRDDGLWVVVKPLIFGTKTGGMKCCFIPSFPMGDGYMVPAGFQTDLASVPRIPFIYDALGSTANEAAVLHDYLYSRHVVDRKTADAIFLEAAKSTGVPWWRRYAMWAGIRLFGGAHW